MKVSRILRPRKSLFYGIHPLLNQFIFKVPGSDPRKLQSSLKSQSDVICYDLEDSVSIHQKVFQLINYSLIHFINRIMLDNML